MKEGLPKMKLNKVMEPIQVHIALRHIKDHCSVVYETADIEGHNPCDLCNLQEFCYQQFGQDQPKDWDLSFLKKYKLNK